MTKIPPHELATPEEWSQARHRESILRPLVAKSSFSEPEIELAGEQMGVGRAYFYRLLSAYRLRPQSSTLLPRRDGLPTGTQLLSPGTESIVHTYIEDFYMSRVRPSFAALMRTISHECQRGHIQPPNFRTIKRRLATYDPKDLIASRFGSKAAREAFRPVQEHDLPALPFQLLQIDHSPVDLIVVDDRDRLPIGRPWLTLVIDVATRCVGGFYLSLESPSVVSVAIALTQCVLPKDTWLAERGLGSLDWPIHGIPDEIHLDNAKEFHSHALLRGAQEYGMELSFRPLGAPHYGGHIERLIGTTMGAVHLLPGTTFSNIKEKGSYNSVKQAAMTMAELERWLALEILGRYHKSVHTGLQISPQAAWEKGMLARRPLREVGNAKQFFCDFLPGERRLIRRDGIRLFNINYWSNVLTPLAGRSKTPVLVKYDPRDLSRVYMRDGGDLPNSQRWGMPWLSGTGGLMAEGEQKYDAMVASAQQLSEKSEEAIEDSNLTGEQASAFESSVKIAGRANGINPNALVGIAMNESGLDPTAQNPNSSASGLFGLTDNVKNAYGLSAADAKGSSPSAITNQVKAASSYLHDLMQGPVPSGHPDHQFEIALGYYRGSRSSVNKAMASKGGYNSMLNLRFGGERLRHYIAKVESYE